MEDRDKELCAKLSEENEELKEACRVHQEYERRLQEFEKKGLLNSTEELEKKRIKKLKLAVKDKIESFLSTSR
jgi:uncharacterized protein YdcH (DUF465 family)